MKNNLLGWVGLLIVGVEKILAAVGVFGYEVKLGGQPMSFWENNNLTIADLLLATGFFLLAYSSFRNKSYPATVLFLVLAISSLFLVVIAYGSHHL